MEINCPASGSFCAAVRMLRGKFIRKVHMTANEQEAPDQLFSQITRRSVDDSRICVTCALEFIMKTF